MTTRRSFFKHLAGAAVALASIGPRILPGIAKPDFIGKSVSINDLFNMESMRVSPLWKQYYAAGGMSRCWLDMAKSSRQTCPENL